MNKKYLPSALILYLNYFIHGVGCSILGQAVIKDALATAWGVEAMAITAISAALGLGRLIALPFALLNLHFPSFVNKAIGSVANTATPLALISIGASFEGKKALKKMKPTLLASFIKLILLAGLFLPLAVFFGYRNQELMALLVMLGSPTTVSSYIMAKNTGNDGILTSSIIVLTTLLSSLTLTLWIFVLKSFGVL